jgi:hypothetical protein
MKCPRCVQLLEGQAVCCPHCGYSLASACALYGSEAVVAERLMDVEGLLTPPQREAVLEGITGFSREFPQLFLLMYLGPLPPPASPRQFAFWLLNHAAVPGLDVGFPNERGVLLVVDPRHGTAVLAGGYYVETLLSQAELDAALRPAGKELSRGDFPGALQVVLRGLAWSLKQRARTAGRMPEAYATGAAGFPPLVRTGEILVVEELAQEERTPGEQKPPPGRRTAFRPKSAAPRPSQRRR